MNRDSITHIPEEFSREALLIGEDNTAKLMRSRVAVFGLGGVGGTAAEALCRSGIGHLLLIDGDVFSPSNINRQIFATREVMGMCKTLGAAKRLKSINPELKAELYDLFYNEETADEVPIERCDCVIDAIDTISSKLLLIENCVKLGVPVVSCMGAGNKLDPSRFEAADISETTVCPLARIMRKELRKRGIEHLRVVYSTEPPIAPAGDTPLTASGRPVPGSVAFCAPAAGLVTAAEAIKILINK